MPAATATRPILTVVEISLGDPERDYDDRVEFLDRDCRIVRVGALGDLDRAEDLVRAWAPQADVLALSGTGDPHAGLSRRRERSALRRLAALAGPTPVTDGETLSGVLQEWLIRHVHADFPGYFTNARVVVLGGPEHDAAVRALRDHTDNVTFLDPIRRVDLTRRLHANPVVGLASDLTLLPWRTLPHALRSRVEEGVEGPATAVSAATLRGAAREADVLVTTYDELDGFALEDLAGKTLVASSVTDDQVANLRERGAYLVLDSVPQPFKTTVTTATLGALMHALVVGHEPTSDDYLEMITAAGLEPRVLWTDGVRRRSRFAFVIHPLSQEFFAQVEPLRTITRHSPGVVVDLMEKALAYAPPFTYTRVTGITSPTGAEAEGWLISVGGTPRELMAHSPEFTYARLLAAAETARKLGAQVMGLGAFTKVVGDAGVTVSKRAPLPITTGNSYSASAALWAAHEAVVRLGLAEVDEDGRIRGKAMVVGATGAIGSVCARLLAMACDELWLVSPESAKLLALKHEIDAGDHRAEVHVAASPDEHLAEMDVIVTATSGAGKRVLDISAVKPGCVITDVARPLDLSAEDVATRPDVLVVESGEIELPGEVSMRDIGLPHGVAYACLAETIVLALEGRYENFTVGRAIEWEKVKEIYRLGLKHGMRLATISGVNGPFTDEDIARVRERALAARAGQ